VSEKNQFPFNSIFLVGRTFVLPIFAKKSVVEVLFGVLHVFFDKIGTRKDIMRGYLHENPFLS